MVLPNQKLSWSVQSEGRTWSCSSSLSFIIVWVWKVWMGDVYQLPTPVGHGLAGTCDLFGQTCSTVVFQDWNVGWSVWVSVTIYEDFRGKPHPLTTVNKGTWVCWSIQAGVTHVVGLSSSRVDLVMIGLLPYPVFSVLVNWSVWRVNFCHLVLILSSTSITSFGIWHTKNPWKFKLMQSGCDWFIL